MSGFSGEPLARWFGGGAVVDGLKAAVMPLLLPVEKPASMSGPIIRQTARMCSAPAVSAPRFCGQTPPCSMSAGPLRVRLVVHRLSDCALVDSAF